MEGEREGEKHQCVAVSHTPPTRDPAPTGNRTREPLVHKPVLNPLRHTRQGKTLFSFLTYCSHAIITANKINNDSLIPPNTQFRVGLSNVSWPNNFLLKYL